MNFEDYISSPIPPKCSINEEEMFFAPSRPLTIFAKIVLIGFAIFMVWFTFQIISKGDCFETAGMFGIYLLMFAVVLCPQTSYDVYIKLNKKGLHYYSNLSRDITLPTEIPLNLTPFTNKKEGDFAGYYQEQVIPYSNVLEIQFEESINKLCSKGISIITVVTNDDRIYIALEQLQESQLKWLVEAGNVMLSHLKGKPLKKLEKSLSLDQMQELESEIFQNDNSNTESNK